MGQEGTGGEEQVGVVRLQMCGQSFSVRPSVRMSVFSLYLYPLFSSVAPQGVVKLL